MKARTDRIRVDSNVSLKWLKDAERWQIDFKFPRRGFRRLPIDVQSRSEALLKAAEFADHIRLYGVVPERQNPEKEIASSNVRIDEAIMKAIQLSKSIERTKRDYIQTANRFLTWLITKDKRIVYWRQVSVTLLREYHAWLHDQGLQPATIRHSFDAIRMASQLWSLENPDIYRDIYKAAAIKLPKIKPGKVIALNPLQLLTVEKWARMNTPNLLPIIMLRGYAGMRGFEAAFLRFGDINFKSKTITLEDRGNHKLKNDHSQRTIPVLDSVLEAIEEYTGKTKAAPVPQAPLFVNSLGNPWTRDSISLANKRAMRYLSWQNRYWDKDKRLAEDFDFSKLRHTFQSMCRKAGVDYILAERYVGHKLEGMGAQRYWDEITVDELKAVTKALKTYIENFLKTCECSQVIHS